MPTPIKWGTEFLLNTTKNNDQYQSSIQSLADGRFVVTWADTSQSADDNSGFAIRAQIFDADGSKSGV